MVFRRQQLQICKEGHIENQLFFRRLHIFKNHTCQQAFASTQKHYNISRSLKHNTKQYQLILLTIQNFIKDGQIGVRFFKSGLSLWVWGGVYGFAPTGVHKKCADVPPDARTNRKNQMFTHIPPRTHSVFVSVT